MLTLVDMVFNDICPISRMSKMFENSPKAEQTQVTFWTLYKDTFAPFTEYPMLQAADIIRNVTIQFPDATASVVHDPAGIAQDRFVIQNIRRRLRPPSPFRFRCLWKDGVDCGESQSQETPEKLYNHLLEKHVLHHQSGSLRCMWSTCDYKAPSESTLRRHVRTHIPSPAPPPKHLGQPSSITLPPLENPTNSNPGAKDISSTPMLRPYPPAPVNVLKFRGAPGQGPVVEGQPPPPPSAPPNTNTLLALYSLRMLFWASFTDRSLARTHHTAETSDEANGESERFGFPSLPSLQHDLEKEERERGGDDDRIRR